MHAFSYGFARHLPGITFADAVARTTEALKGEGFGILAEIDVAGTLKKKLDVDLRPYTILGACNPALASKAIAAEPQIGLLLPCNVLVQGEGDGMTVSIADPKAMFAMVDNPGLVEVDEDWINGAKGGWSAFTTSASASRHFEAASRAELLAGFEELTAVAVAEGWVEDTPANLPFFFRAYKEFPAGQGSLSISIGTRDDTEEIRISMVLNN